MRNYLAAIFIIILASGVFADEYRDYMNQGEKQYKSKDYTNSADQYHQAEVLKPEDPLAGFNSGAALYRAEDIDKAAEKFSQTAGITEGEFKSDAYYNLGNSLYQKQDYQGAQEAYRNSLINNPTRQDAKFNYELAEIKKQEQQQQKQQKQQQDQNQDDKQDKKDQKQEQQQNQDKQDQQQQKQQEKQQPKQEEQEQQQQPQPKKGEMTEQEAKDLLEAFKEDEKQIQKELKKFQVRPSSRRDW